MTLPLAPLPASQHSHPSSQTPLPAAWWLLLAVYSAGVVWLAARSRVFIDQIWTTEYGRRVLDPANHHTMLMLPDGSTPMPASWLGPVIAEFAFRLSDGHMGFRLVAAAAALVLAWSIVRLFQRHGVPSTLAVLTAGALLFDASMLQSITLGRPDSVALALLFGGMLLASWAVSTGFSATRTLVCTSLGYVLCALAPAVWSAALLLGLIVILHLVLTIRSLLQTYPDMPRVRLCWLLLPPALVFFVAVFAPFALWTEDSTQTRVQWFVQSESSILEFLDFAAQQVSVSVCLVLAGAFALTQIKPRWVAAVLLVGMLSVLASGFYPFRLPYLLAYAVVAIGFYSAQLPGEQARSAWLKLMALCLVVALGLFGVRMLLSLSNEAAPKSEPWFSTYPPELTIADFSWDFYEAARKQQRPIMRSIPSIDSNEVQRWLAHADPDYIVHAVDGRSTWVMVDDLSGLLTLSNYCQIGLIDWSGVAVDPQKAARQPPSPLLWRMGMFRDYGPYALWQRCPSPAL